MTYRETTVGEARAAKVAGLEGYPDDMKVVCDMPDVQPGPVVEHVETVEYVEPVLEPEQAIVEPVETVVDSEVTVETQE